MILRVNQRDEVPWFLADVWKAEVLVAHQFAQSPMGQLVDHNVVTLFAVVEDGLLEGQVRHDVQEVPGNPLELEVAAEVENRQRFLASRYADQDRIG